MLLKVTDAFQHGDQFSVNVNSGAYLFNTSAVPPDPASSTGDPDVAFADPTYSSGSILLPAGAYSVDVFTMASPFGSGGAYLEVESSAIPEPATPLLVVGGLAAGFLWRRRERRR
jgi:hypothetical protein